MSRRFTIEDAVHAERHGMFECRRDAIARLERDADLPFDEPPNQPPCQDWQACERCYDVIE